MSARQLARYLDEIQRPPTDRERQLIALKVAAPLRSPAGRVIERQHNIDELPLFLVAQEPSLL